MHCEPVVALGAPMITSARPSPLMSPADGAVVDQPALRPAAGRIVSGPRGAAPRPTRPGKTSARTSGPAQPVDTMTSSNPPSTFPTATLRPNASLARTGRARNATDVESAGPVKTYTAPALEAPSSRPTAETIRSLLGPPATSPIARPRPNESSALMPAIETARRYVGVPPRPNVYRWTEPPLAFLPLPLPSRVTAEFRHR